MKRFLQLTFKKAAAIIGLCGMSYLNADAQAPTLSWNKTLGGSGGETSYSMQQTANGGYILCAHFNSAIPGEKTHAKSYFFA